MSFYFPFVLFFLLFLPVIFLKKREMLSSINFGNVSLIKENADTYKFRQVNFFLKALKFFTMALFIFALARPRIAKENVWEETKGIDILLVLDISSSMLAEDFTIGSIPYSRLEVVKRVVGDFIKGREEDRIGIVIFSGEPMTLCPLTTDYSVVEEFLGLAKIGMLEDGTAIGDSIAFGVGRLMNAKGKSKVMILLTDGANNAGQLDPSLSSDIAATKKIKIYTIGAGKKGKVPVPRMDPFGGKKYFFMEMPIDEELLKNIANKTGGRFYRATSTKALKEIYNEIDALEKTKVKTSKSLEYKEIFPWFLIPAILLLFLEIIFKNILYVRVP